MTRPLSDLLHAAGIASAGVPDARVSGVRVDSRKVQPGDMFLALRGTQADGMSFVEAAANAGAAALLVESEGNGRWEALHGVPALRVPALRARTGLIFDAWHGHPSRSLEFFGVTGTNGKSTTVLLMSGILKAAARRPVTLGTIRYEIGDTVLDSSLTTPSTADFYDMLARGVAAGCDCVAMEASSHALAQDRVAGVRFARALFTNLTQDHLDFHADFEEYFAAKKRLFTEYLAADGIGIVNLDAPYGARLLKEWAGRRLTFSRGETPEGRGADVRLESADLRLEGSTLRIAHGGKTFEVRSPLVGSLNVENLLAATAFGISLGFAPDVIARGLAGVRVPGRNEVFRLANGAFAVVDYAHTPDALERVLSSLRPLVPGALSVVFGCGGDRDRGKRPLMGGIAERQADRVILTSDNPRSEAPAAILADIRGGMARPEEARTEIDRRAAIRAGLEALRPGDCLLVAGKGHEDYQIAGGRRTHFSDQEEIAAWAAGKGAAWN